MNNEPTPGDAHDPDRSDIRPDTKDIYCPHCDYNLHGLTERRCPECGHLSDIGRVYSRPKMSAHLFERHEWTDIGMLMRTAVGGFRLNEFWTAVDRIGPPRIGMILWYWFAGALLYLVTVCQDILAAAFYYAPGEWPTLSTTQGVFRGLCSWKTFIMLWYFAVVPLSWTWSTFAVLWAFRGSMRRPPAKTGRLLRCALYCFDAPFWMGIILLPFSTLELALAIRGHTLGLDKIFVITYLLGLLGIATGSSRLVTALEQELWADQPYRVVVMSQAAVLALTGIMSIAPFAIFYL